MKHDKIFRPSARPWQLRWWRENPERWRWAGTFAVIFALMGIFAQQNPGIWQQDTAPVDYSELPITNWDPPPALADLWEGIPLPDDLLYLNADDAAGFTIADLQDDVLVPDQDQDSGLDLEEAEAVPVAAAPQSWLMPISGSWSRDFGHGADPTLGGFRFHSGVDIEAEGGAPVFAAAEGTIIMAQEDAFWGGIIIIEHGGNWRTTYKAIQPTAEVGTIVSAGEQIGTVLEVSPPAEAAQPPHLHFEIELDGQLQNPRDWLPQ